MSTQKPDANKKTHWHLLSLMVPSPGQWQPVSFMGSYSSKQLSLPVIQALRTANGVPETAVLMSVSYIGLMSKHAMAGTSDAIVPTKLSDAFRQGLITASANVDPRAEVKNPYEEFASVSREMLVQANEWAEGFAEGVHVRETARTLNNAAFTQQIPAQ